MEFIGKKSFQMYRVADEVAAADDEGEGEDEGRAGAAQKVNVDQVFLPRL